MGEEVALRTIVCVLRSGGDFRPEHAQWLARQVPGIVCLTDMEVPGVETRPLRMGWPGWWSKMEAYGPTIDPSHDILLMDLDTVVLRLPELPTETTVLADFNRPHDTIGSGLVYATAADRKRIWEAFNADPARHIRENNRWPDAWGDQGFLLPLLRGAKRWGHNVRSYKVHCRNGVPAGTDVVAFHGKPRPFGLDLPWVPMMQPAHKDFRDLILKHKGARICVMGGAPSLVSDLSRVEADVFISTNGHGVHLRTPDYLFAMDDTNTQKNNVEMGAYLRGLSNAPIIAPRNFADYHLSQWPQQPRWVLSGMTATWAAFVMGANVAILAGFDAYGGAPGYIDEGRKMARDVKCQVRVVSGPLTKVWQAYDPEEAFGPYIAHSAIEGWLGRDGRITIRARKPCMVGNVSLNPNETLTTYRQDVWRLLKHRMVEEIMPEPAVHEVIEPGPAEAVRPVDTAVQHASIKPNRAERRRARQQVAH